MIRALLLLTAAAAVALPAWLVATARFGPERLQRLAESSCECARSFPHAKAACWARFDWQARKTYSYQPLIAVIPIAEDPICRSDGLCIILRYRVVVAPNAPDLCTFREAEMGNAFWGSRVRSTGTGDEIQQAFEDANASLGRFAAEIAKGERPEALRRRQTALP
jgi:hypothetical protein